MSTAPTLRQYQLDTLEAITTSHRAGLNRLLVRSATGTGKTVCFAQLPQALDTWLANFPKGERKMLVIAHREELLDQAAAKIHAANPGLHVTIEQGERRASFHADIVVASIQTLSAYKFRRLHRLLERMVFRIVIVDEAHHAAADSYRSCLAHLGFLPKADISENEEADVANYDDVLVMEQALAGWDKVAPKDRLLIGFTATPNRTDAIGLGCVFQSIVYSYGMKEAITDEWLVPIKPWVIETGTSLDDVKLQRGDFNQAQLANAVNNAKRNHLAVAAWHEYADDLATLAFTVDVQHAHDLAQTFQNDGVRAMAVSGETPKEDRRIILRQYQDGQLDVVTNCMVLTEGTDLPRTSCILHAKPTKSATLYEQMTGRGLRLFEGKRECIVIDLVDVARRHSLQTSPVLYGLPPGLLVKGKDLRETSEELERLLEANPSINLEQLLAGGHLTLEQLRAKAQTFDVWTVPSLGAFGAGRALNWMKVNDDLYRLQYPWADGTEVLRVQRDLIGRWEVSVMLRTKEGESRQRTIAADIATDDDAAGMAEAFVLQERRSVTKLKDKDAPWRAKPASEKQVALLRKLRVPPEKITKGITMGQASDLIDIVNARRHR